MPIYPAQVHAQVVQERCQALRCFRYLKQDDREELMRALLDVIRDSERQDCEKGVPHARFKVYTKQVTPRAPKAPVDPVVAGQHRNEWRTDRRRVAAAAQKRRETMRAAKESTAEG